ncbi:uncharacterized protein LOC106767733 [Vigna radiata var. radiata]|uniref:Uncharacterized protein LOC106767733 n=1 Tax=Vigna radiata var. radiata TaxID=3916 RepID=A0A1S3UQF4_VIGRR|nr:uncharacterized protein LOC106767733 [Vigna radiata var. radiata]
MNNLHSLAYTSTTTSLCGSSLGWDYHNIGVLNADKMSLMEAMEGSTPSLSPQHSDFSTGYLEDALIESCERSKRRRLLPCTTTDGHSMSFIDDLEQSFWNFNPLWHTPVENFNFYCMNQIERFCGFSDELISTSRSEEANVLVADSKTPEETISASESLNSSSSSYKQSVTCKTTDPTVAPTGSDEMGNKKVVTRVVYPFAMVKPGGREGDVTLNDINERILMPPTRPVRHPVGDFACRPCVSAEGPGLSGKAVVALTRIHTQGRGTITIIRTKG